MYQFTQEDTALQAARLLAVHEGTPVLVMARATMDVFSIGPLTNPALRAAGQPRATVHCSGQVEYMRRADDWRRVFVNY